MKRGCLFALFVLIMSCSNKSAVADNTDVLDNPPPERGQPTDPVPQAPFKKVFIMILENTNSTAAAAQPYLGKLAKAGAYLNNISALTHPSQPNYIGLTSGDLNGVSGNGKYDLNVPNIADLIEAKGKTWKAYAEDYPGNCFVGDKGKYRRKHAPFISYVSISKNPARCKNIVNATELLTDLKSGNIPDYSFYSPNLDNDGHDTGVAFASKWLERTFDSLLRDPVFMKDMLFIVTFDEDGGTRPNMIYTALVGPGVMPGTVSNTRYTLYSLLRTIEEGLGLGNLGKKDSTAPVIDDVWR